MRRTSAAKLASTSKWLWQQQQPEHRRPRFGNIISSTRRDHGEAVLGAAADSASDIELEPLPSPALDDTRDPHRQFAFPPQPLLAPEAESKLKRREKVCRLLETEMKFSHSIQFNAVPDWSSYYINYSNLKKLIYQLEKQIHQQQPSKQDGHPDGDAESSPLLRSTSGGTASGFPDDPDKVFSKKLDDELEKIASFYQLKELEIYGEVDGLLKDVKEYQEEHATGEGAEEGQGLRRPSLWTRTRQNSIFKSLQLGGSGGASSKGGGRRRRSSNMGAGDRAERGIPEEDEQGDDSDDDAADHANENTRLTVSQPNMGRRATTAIGGSTSNRRLSDSYEPATRDTHSSTEVRRRPSTAAFNDFDSDALDALYSEGVTLKKRITNLYVSVCELRSYIQLNETGFSKVLKKYDKTLDRSLKSAYLANNVKPAYPFLPSTMETLNDHLLDVEKAYAGIVTSGDLETARRELRLHLREHVVWERNTVWREMIGIERKAQAANLGIRGTMLGRDTADQEHARRQGDAAVDSSTKEVSTPVGRYTCPRFLLTSTFWTLIFCLAVFAVLLFGGGAASIVDDPAQQNCLALVIFISLLWATEAIPLFVTSLLVPFLVVLLNVAKSDAPPHHRLESKAAASYVFAAMWTPVIMLLLGGFTIAAALSKYNIAKMMATFVLSKAGTRPRTVLLTSMGVAMFASMWISNVAAPVLCFSIIQPILRNLPSDSPMSKALLLGIALSSNIGGAASPIASPQNLIALQNMEPQPGWGIWFFIALPVCIISLLLIWILLLVTFRPDRGTTIVPIRPMKDRFTALQWFISFITVLTILLWCLSHQLEPYFGDMGVIAILPLLAFFGTGILTKEDFNNFLWTIIILAAGGLALGKAVTSSGLLTTIATSITSRVAAMNLYALTCTFAALIAVIATFISHTVAALIILPLVREVGSSLPSPHPNLLVMSSVLMASAAMGLPTSGFPNMTAIMMEDPATGRRYLRVGDFLTRGIPASVLSYGVIVTVGFGLMRVLGY
ncbi:SPX domain-containing protein [Hortaea werneckii]|nr:SPX domain-containing protein [Hortaea werneckii]